MPPGTPQMRRQLRQLIEIVGLTNESVELVNAVYQPWTARVSYYFPIEAAGLDHTLFAQPEVHPARFQMEPDSGTP